MPDQCRRSALGNQSMLLVRLIWYLNIFSFPFRLLRAKAKCQCAIQQLPMAVATRTVTAAVRQLNVCPVRISYSMDVPCALTIQKSQCTIHQRMTMKVRDLSKSLRPAWSLCRHNHDCPEYACIMNAYPSFSPLVHKLHYNHMPSLSVIPSFLKYPCFKRPNTCYNYRISPFSNYTTAVNTLYVFISD